MSFRRKYPISGILDEIDKQIKADFLATKDVAEDVHSYIKNELEPRLTKKGATWEEFATFWPPRCIEGARDNNATIFFGAGLSLPCGIPTWNALLSETFGLEKALTTDADLTNDPLTLAELASQYLGSEVLQSILRDEMKKDRKHSISHTLIAALRFPVYITTNYDLLFEQAWNLCNNKDDLIIVTNDGDLLSSDYQNAHQLGKSILYKIHGSADRESEHMILTRKDYRSHYRVNDGMFRRIRELLKERHTVFLGFSHNDPEVSRLVEDAIYDFEKQISQLTDPRPQFYSLQFDMKEHTPEIFAARGIVTLMPPTVKSSLDQVKTKSLAIALADLLVAQIFDLHKSASFDQDLRDVTNEIADVLNANLEKLGNYSIQAEQQIANPTTEYTWLDNLCSDLGDFASQGVYLTDEFGKCLCSSFPSGLSPSSRVFTKPLNERPYFRQSKSFREPFVSDFYESIFNKNSTFFLCYPILKNGKFTGLLFSAVQIGQWDFLINTAKKHWAKGQSFLVLDSNGICGLPPHNEFQTEKPKGRDSAANEGYIYKKLLSISRRDALVKHISKSVVPITQDDDVLRLSGIIRNSL